MGSLTKLFRRRPDVLPLCFLKTVGSRQTPRRFFSANFSVNLNVCVHCWQKKRGRKVRLIFRNDRCDLNFRVQRGLIIVGSGNVGLSSSSDNYRFCVRGKFRRQLTVGKVTVTFRRVELPQSASLVSENTSFKPITTFMENSTIYLKIPN